MDSNPEITGQAGFSQAAGVPSRAGARAWGRSLLGELLGTVLPALLIAIVMVLFVVQPTRVEGSSMAPTLLSGQRLVIEKVAYRFREPERGEIVVFQLPGQDGAPLIKRLIAVEGDVVAIRNGDVYLNGTALAGAHRGRPTMGDLSPTVVPEDHIFVLGDNRGASNDSRSFGMVPADHVVGRAILRYWPLLDSIR